MTWTSWNGNITHPVNEILKPQTEQELCRAVAQARSVRVVGAGFSSADICGGVQTLLSLENYTDILQWQGPDAQGNRLVTVQAGAKLKDLIVAGAERGVGFPALSDIDAVTLGGALATGTHGTGRQALSLSGYLVSLRLVQADGTIREVGSGDPDFPACQVSLGLLGISSTFTFRLEPLRTLFLAEKSVKDQDWITAFPRWIETHEFVRLLWLPHTGSGYAILGDQAWTPGLATFSGEPVFRPKAAPGHHRHRRKVSARLYALAARWPRLTGVVNRILARLFFSAPQIHSGNLYDATVTKSRSGTLELAEWTIPLSRFEACFRDLKAALDTHRHGAFAHIPMDVRFIKGEDSWLGNSQGEDTVTVGCVTRHAATADTYHAFRTVEEVFLSHGGRPHWAKRFAAGPEVLKPLYPRWEDFRRLRRERDPEGKFLNSYLAEFFK